MLPRASPLRRRIDGDRTSTKARQIGGVQHPALPHAVATCTPRCSQMRLSVRMISAGAIPRLAFAWSTRSFSETMPFRGDRRTRLHRQVDAEPAPFIWRQRGFELFPHVVFRSLEQLGQVRRIHAPAHGKRVRDHVKDVEGRSERISEHRRIRSGRIGRFAEIRWHQYLLRPGHVDLLAVAYLRATRTSLISSSTSKVIEHRSKRRASERSPNPRAFRRARGRIFSRASEKSPTPAQLRGPANSRAPGKSRACPIRRERPSNSRLDSVSPAGRACGMS
jgi:hypothetical protein